MTAWARLIVLVGLIPAWAFAQAVGGASSSGASTLDALTDTTITAAADGDGLRHNGTAWVDTAMFDSGTSDLLASVMSANGLNAVSGGDLTDGSGVSHIWLTNATHPVGYKTTGWTFYRTGLSQSNGSLTHSNDGVVLSLGYNNASYWVVDSKPANKYMGASSDFAYKWSSSTTSSSSSIDTRLRRLSAGILTVDNGSDTTLGGMQLGSLTVQDPTATTGITSVIFKGGAWQSTNGIFEVQESDGTKIFAVDIGSNQFWGQDAGAAITSGANNTVIGHLAGDAMSTSSHNILLGRSTGGALETGSANTLIGTGAMAFGTSMANNVAVGYKTAEQAGGSNNTYIGFGAVRGVTSLGGGSDNVIIGYNAGYDETGSNTLIIDNQDRGGESAGRTDSLIYGLFNATASSQTLDLNARVSVGYGLDIEDGGTQPTCDSSTRGYLWMDEGGAGVADSFAVCAKDSGDAYAWRTIY